MSFKVESNRLAFETKLQTLKNAIENRKLIDINLNTVEKSGFWWCLLYVMRPFYALFAQDVYSHVRAHNVAQSILKYSEVNKQFFFEDAHLIEEIKNQILVALDNKTHTKYHDKFELIIKNLNGLIPPEPKSKIPTIPVKPNPRPDEWVWPADLSDLGITDQQKRC